MNDIKRLHEIIKAFFEYPTEFEKLEGYYYKWKDIEICPSGMDKDSINWYWVRYGGIRVTWEKADGLVVYYGSVKTISDFSFTEWHEKIMQQFNSLKK